jgi:hypothetical protein
VRSLLVDHVTVYINLLINVAITLDHIALMTTTNTLPLLAGSSVANLPVASFLWRLNHERHSLKTVKKIGK